MNPRITPKEHVLIMGAIRRIYSRSELRRGAILVSSAPDFMDMTRPRVKKWSICPKCQQFIPTYLMEVYHVSPVVPLDKTLQEMSWEELINNIWCEPSNLIALCKPCHLTKSTIENSIRRDNKREKRSNVKRCKSIKRPIKTTRKRIVNRRARKSSRR